MGVESSEELQLVEINIECNGAESHLSQCPIVEGEGEDFMGRCGALQNAYVICQGNAVACGHADVHT